MSRASTLPGARRALADDPELRALAGRRCARCSDATAPRPCRPRCARARSHRRHAGGQPWTRSRARRSAARRTPRCASRSTSCTRAGERGGERRQHRGAHGDRALRAQDPARGGTRRHHLGDPAAHGLTQMLDLGANTKATPQQLRSSPPWAIDHRARCVRPRQPRIGLLNIGDGRHEGARSGAGSARADRRDAA